MAHYETADLRPTEGANEAGRRIVKCLRYGMRLAILGVLDGATTNEEMRWWHVVRPGSYSMPGLTDQGLTWGKSVCGRIIITNGYAADFAPPNGSLCPACAEQM